MTPIRMLMAAAQAALAEMPKNDSAWSYTIRGFDGDPYISRTLLPRLGAIRPVLHRIHRADADPYPHNHPWRWAKFLIVSGGYIEEREGHEYPRILKPGDVNHLTADTFHRVSYVWPNTWTLGLLGPREQSWGFKVDGEVIESGEFFRCKNYASSGGES